MQGKGEALQGLYLSGLSRQAHSVGLRHAPSFQQFGFQAPPMLSGNGFSGMKVGDSLPFPRLVFLAKSYKLSW